VSLSKSEKVVSSSLFLSSRPWSKSWCERD
jgi:hypothetical protein